MKTPARPAARNVRVVRVGEFNPDGKKPLSGRVSSGLSGLSKYIEERKEKRPSLTANSTTIARDSGRKFFIRRFSEKYPDNPANPDEPLRHSSFLDLPTRTEYPVRPGSTRTEQAYTPEAQARTKTTLQSLVGNPVRETDPTTFPPRQTYTALAMAGHDQVHVKLANPTKFTSTACMFRPDGPGVLVAGSGRSCAAEEAT